MTMFSYNTKLVYVITISVLFRIGRCLITDGYDIIEDFPAADYDKRIKPIAANDSTKIQVNIYILSTSNFNDNNMEYDIQIYFRQFWQDDRLSYNGNFTTKHYTTVDDPNLIWTPDLFFVNEKKGRTHDVPAKNSFIKIYPAGNVSYSQRLTLTLKCPMDFSNFPFDVQNCPILIESYGFDAKDISLEWKMPDPILISNDYEVTLPLVSLENDWATTVTVRSAREYYDRLAANLKFTRKLTYYMLHVHVPCIMITILSWTAFWIRHKHLTGRILIGMSTLLCMSSMVYMVNSYFPKTSYLRAIDIFAGMSLTNCFLTFIVTIFVHFKDDAEEFTENLKVDTNQGVEKKTDNLEQLGKLKRFKIWILQGKSGYSKVDTVSRTIFPIAYFLFVLCYFSICLNLKD